MKYLLLVIAGLATAQTPVDVVVTVDPPEIPFHRQATVAITVEAPASAEVNLPQLTGKFGGLNVYGEPDFTSEPLPNGRKRVTETYILDPVFIGDYPVEPAVATVDGVAYSVPVPAIRVRDLTEDEAKAAMEFVESVGPVDMQTPLLQRWEVWAVFAAVAAAIIGVLIYLLRSRNVVQRLTPPPTAWDVAYNRMRELDARKWPEQGRVQPYYVELSSILRHYIEDRFTLHAPEMTTPEFLAEASRSGVLTADHQDLLAHFLRHCDRVKFAQFRPSQGDMERSFSEVLRFIDETIPKRSEAEEVAA